MTLAPQNTEPQVQISYTKPPTVVTEAASGISQTYATLNATIDPEGSEVSSCYFEYGTSPSYGSSTPCVSLPGSGTSSVAVSAGISGLEAKTIYHYRVSATNSGGTSTGGDQTFETLPDPPAVTSVSPDAGLAFGGTSVTMTGTELTGATRVMFGSTEATSLEVDSPTTITAISPKGTPGTVEVTVTTSGGTSTPGASDQFSYIAPGSGPVISKLSVKKGPAAGGTQVAITGTGFVGVTAVKFGSANASFKVNSPTSIAAVSPQGTAGQVAVTVTTPNGESEIASKDDFTFEAPTVTSISPDSGPTAGGTRVTVRGSGFGLGSTATTFEFGGARYATTVDCATTTECTMLTPTIAKAKPVEVKARVNKRGSKKNPPADQFTYN